MRRTVIEIHPVGWALLPVLMQTGKSASYASVILQLPLTEQGGELVGVAVK